jgi:hypothetical protein
MGDLNHTFEFKSGGSLNLIEGVALNSAAADRTITLDLTGGDSSDRGSFSKVEVAIFYTYGAATTVVATPTRSFDGTNYFRRTSRSTIQGGSSDFLQADTYTTGGASADYSLEYDVRGLSSMKIVFSGASGGASDLITVQAVATVGS